MINVTLFRTNTVKAYTKGEIVDIYDLPNRLNKFYEEHPNTPKSDMPAILPHLTGERTPTEDFSNGKAKSEGNLIFIDLDNINNPKPGYPNIADWCIEHREEIFTWFDLGNNNFGSNVLGLQKSPSGNLHVIIYNPFTETDNFSMQARIMTALFCQKLYDYGIDLNQPVQDPEMDKRGHEKSNAIIDDHNCHIHQFFKLSPNPLYLNDQIRLIKVVLPKKDIDVLKTRYPKLFNTKKIESVAQDADLSYTTKNKSIDQLEYKEDHINYDMRWKIANTATKFWSEEEVISLLRQYSNDKDIPGIVHTAKSKAPSKFGLDWLNERGALVDVKINTMSEEFIDQVKCPVTEQMKSMQQIELGKDDYLSDRLQIEDIQNNRVEIYADCGTGKTEFCFRVLKNHRGDLVVPMNSTLKGKQCAWVDIAKKGGWNLNKSQSMVFDTFVHEARRTKDITFIDEHHLLIDQGDFRSICFDLNQKIKTNTRKTVILTGTPYEIEESDSLKVRVTKNDGFKKTVEVKISENPSKELIDQVINEVKNGNLVLLPDNRNSLDLQTHIEEVLGAGTVGIYKRDRDNTDDVQDLNTKNIFSEGKKVMICTSYLNVGCELKGYNNIVTITNLSNNKFTGQQLHQFANRARSCDHRIIVVVKNSIDLLTYTSDVEESTIDDKKLVDLMEESSLLNKMIKNKFHYFEDDLTIDEEKKSFQLHNQSLIDFYSQFPVVMKYLKDLGYSISYDIKTKSIRKFSTKSNSKDIINDYIENNYDKFMNEYGEALSKNKIVYGEEMKSTEFGYTTPSGNYTSKVYAKLKKLENCGLDKEQIIEVLNFTNWSMSKIDSIIILFDMISNDDKFAQKLLKAKMSGEDKAIKKMKYNLTNNQSKEVKQILNKFFDIVLKCAEMFTEWKGTDGEFVYTILKVVETTSKVKNEKKMIVYDEQGNEVAMGNGVEICEKMNWNRTTFDRRSNKSKYKGYELLPIDEETVLLNNIKAGIMDIDCPF